MSDPQHARQSDSEPQRPGLVRAPGLKAAFLTVLKLAVVALTVFLVVRVAATVGWSEFRRELSAAARLPVTAAALLLLARWWIWQHRWSLSLAAIGETTRARRRFPALAASILVNHVTPTARVLGGIVRSRYFSRPWGGPFSRVFASVLFDQVMHNAVIGVFTWLALIGAAWVLGRWQVSLVAALLLIGVGALAYGRARRVTEPGAKLELTSPLVTGPRRTVERLGDLADHGRETIRLLRDLLRRPALVARATAWTTALFLCNATAQWLLFLALGSDLGLLKVAAVVGLGGFAGALLATPGGIGSTEAAMIAVFSALGVGRVDAVTAVLLYRGLHYALVFSCGLPSLAGLEWHRRRRRGP